MIIPPGNRPPFITVPLVISMSAVIFFSRSVNASSPDIVKSIRPDPFATSFRNLMAPHAVHAYPRVPVSHLYARPTILNLVRPISTYPPRFCTPTDLTPRYRSQAPSATKHSGYYPGGLVLYDRKTGPDGEPVPASRLDFLRAMLRICHDSTFIAGEHLTSTTASALPTALPSEAMIHIAHDAKVILELPRCIFSRCAFRSPEMGHTDDKKLRPSFRSDLSRNHILLSADGARTLDTLLNLTGEKHALWNFVATTPAAQGAAASPNDLLDEQEAQMSRARPCLLAEIRGISAMRDPMNYINAKYPGQALHALVDEQWQRIQDSALGWNPVQVPGTPAPNAEQGAAPPMIDNVNYDPLWRSVPIPAAANTQSHPLDALQAEAR